MPEDAGALNAVRFDAKLENFTVTYIEQWCYTNLSSPVWPFSCDEFLDAATVFNTFKEEMKGHDKQKLAEVSRMAFTKKLKEIFKTSLGTKKSSGNNLLMHFHTYQECRLDFQKYTRSAPDRPLRPIIVEDGTLKRLVDYDYLDCVASHIPDHDRSAFALKAHVKDHYERQYLALTTGSRSGPSRYTVDPTIMETFKNDIIHPGKYSPSVRINVKVKQCPHRAEPHKTRNEVVHLDFIFHRISIHCWDHDCRQEHWADIKFANYPTTELAKKAHDLLERLRSDRVVDIVRGMPGVSLRMRAASTSRSLNADDVAMVDAEVDGCGGKTDGHDNADAAGVTVDDQNGENNSMGEDADRPDDADAVRMEAPLLDERNPHVLKKRNPLMDDEAGGNDDDEEEDGDDGGGGDESGDEHDDNDDNGDDEIDGDNEDPGKGAQHEAISIIKRLLKCNRGTSRDFDKLEPLLRREAGLNHVNELLTGPVRFYADIDWYAHDDSGIACNTSDMSETTRARFLEAFMECTDQHFRETFENMPTNEVFKALWRISDASDNYNTRFHPNLVN
eukprot:gene27609-34068_t